MHKTTLNEFLLMISTHGLVLRASLSWEGEVIISLWRKGNPLHEQSCPNYRLGSGGCDSFIHAGGSRLEFSSVRHSGFLLPWTGTCPLSASFYPLVSLSE